jgi:hypothetical protein
MEAPPPPQTEPAPEAAVTGPVGEQVGGTTARPRAGRTEVAPPGKPAPRRRRRWPIVAVSLLALFAIAYVTFFLRYQPLTADAGTSWVDPDYATRVGPFTSPRGETFTQYNVRYVDGERLAFMFTLRNAGGLPVTIQSVRLDTGCDTCNYPLQQRSTAVLAHGPNETDPAHARDLRPFTLGGDDYRNIVVTARFVNCKDLREGDVITFSSVRVHMRAGFVPHDATLPLGYNLAVSRKSACSP